MKHQLTGQKHYGNQEKRIVTFYGNVVQSY